jgi:hypothetical protein
MLSRVVICSVRYAHHFQLPKNDVGSIGSIGTAVWRIGTFLVDVGRHRELVVVLLIFKKKYKYHSKFLSALHTQHPPYPTRVELQAS